MSRLFSAIELPAEVRQELISVQQRLARRAPGFRWVAAEQMRLTLGRARQEHGERISARFEEGIVPGAAPFTAREIVLFESRLQPGGPVHQARHASPFDSERQNVEPGISNQEGGSNRSSIPS